jgi:hypothetical protein
MFRLPKRGEDTRQQVVDTGREFFQRDPVNEHKEALSDPDTT